MPSPLARAMVAIDPGRPIHASVRPLATPDHDQGDAVRDWLAHLEAGRLVPARAHSPIPTPTTTPGRRARADGPGRC